MPNIKVIDSPIFLKESITKDEFLEQILTNAKRAVEIKTTTFTIVYSGHGSQEDGAWKCSMPDGKLGFDRIEYMVSLPEVINKVVESGYTGNVEMTSDSCYSGLLCIEAQKLWM